MKKLTGKAKVHFEYWLQTERYYLPSSQKNLLDIYTNALIIEWLDSAGINIGITILGGRSRRNFVSYCFEVYMYIVEDKHYILSESCCDFNTRTEATNAAITQAVELFNERT